MSEAQEIKVTKRIDKEGFEAGRLLGVVARRDPELYERIKAYAETRGMKPTDVIYDALALYDEYITLSGVDTKALMAALKLLDNLLRRMVGLMMSLNQLVTSEYFNQQIEILHSLKMREQQSAALRSEEEKKSRAREVREQLLMNTVNLVFNLLTNMMTTMMGLRMQQPSATPSSASSFDIGKPKIVRGGS